MAWQTYLWGFLGIFVVALLVYYFYYIKQFNKRITIHDKSNGPNRVFEDKARVFKGKDKVAVWQCLKSKIKIPIPPPEAISISQKGVQCAVLFREGPDDFKWVCMNAIEAEYTLNKEKQKTYIPVALTTGQKQAMVNQFRLSIEESETQGDKFIKKALPIVVVAIVLISAYLYLDMYMSNAKEVVQAATGAVDRLAQNEASHAEASKIMAEACLQIIDQRQTFFPQNTSGTVAALNGVAPN